jgi:hypothetical protein
VEIKVNIGLTCSDVKEMREAIEAARELGATVSAVAEPVEGLEVHKLGPDEPISPPLATEPLDGWDPALHSDPPKRNNDGTWRKRRGASKLPPQTQPALPDGDVASVEGNRLLMVELLKAKQPVQEVNNEIRESTGQNWSELTEQADLLIARDVMRARLVQAGVDA